MHNREPPPVHILEKLTARGADILNRTVENFQPPQMGLNMANGNSDSENEELTTPKEEKMEIDDPGSGTGRTSRGKCCQGLVSLKCHAYSLLSQVSGNSHHKECSSIRKPHHPGRLDTPLQVSHHHSLLLQPWQLPTTLIRRLRTPTALHSPLLPMSQDPKWLSLCDQL